MLANNVEVDTETLGVRPGCVVLSIGAVKFNPRAGVQTAAELLKDSFTVNIDLRDSLDLGFTIDPDTLLWWMKQSKEAQASAFSKPTVPPAVALTSFVAWFKEKEPGVQIWGNGSDFDVPILQAYFDKLGLQAPWKFRNVRCHRTIKNSFTYNEDLITGNLIHHDALSDAIYQAQELQSIVVGNPSIKLD